MPATRTKPDATELVARLDAHYPDATYELNWDDPLQLLVATILAAQCTDVRVNEVTPTLFARFPTAEALADADTAELEELVRPTGFYKQKAAAIRKACGELVARFAGEVPPRMDDLVTLPRVARKTANVVLNIAFKQASGVIVDSHFARVSQRLGLTKATDTDDIERDLMAVVPNKKWIAFGPAMVLHGRRICTASKPACGDCVLEDVCPKVGVESPGRKIVPKKTPPAPAAVPEPAALPAAPAGDLPASWRTVLAAELAAPYFRTLQDFVAAERSGHEVFPPADEVYTAFQLCPFDKVRVLLLGQDPYPTEGHAHGLCFSVKPGVAVPGSLRNMYKELKDDLGIDPPKHGYLAHWAEQGILMVNAVLTVRAGEANSHAGKGWETFTDAVIKAVSAKAEPVVFVLWGAYARKKAKLIDATKHVVIESAHPSPLSAKLFAGTRPFSKINAALAKLGEPPIDWKLPDAV